MVFMFEYLPGGDLRHYLKSKLEAKKQGINNSEFMPSGISESEA
jgi:hypothetical protein